MKWLAFIDEFLILLKELLNDFLGKKNTKTMTIIERVKQAIQQEIVLSLNLPYKAINILLAQAVVETGHFTSTGFLGNIDREATNSLFNRHKGSGRGEWTGRTVYLSSGDQDVRVYTDVYQSARDMKQLLQDPLYSFALQALQEGDEIKYYLELQKAGFSATPTYAKTLKNTYDAIA